MASYSAKSCGHLPDIGHEDEAPDLRVEILQGVDELEHEPGDVPDRVGHVAEHHDLRLVLALVVEDDAERHAAVLQVAAQGGARVEPPPLGAPPPDRHDIAQALRELVDRLLHPPDLVLGEIEEALLGEILQALPILTLHVLAVELLAHGALDEVLQVTQAARQILVESPGHVGVRPGQIAPEPVELAAEIAEAERLCHRVAEAALLEAVLDLIDARLPSRLAQQLLEPAGIALRRARASSESSMPCSSSARSRSPRKRSKSASSSSRAACVAAVASRMASVMPEK